MTHLHAAAIATALLGLAACGSEKPPEAAARPVAVTVVARSALGETVRLAGEVQARKDVDLSFRIGGRVIARKANVGDRVEPGQLLARLDPATEENALKAARATLDAARGELARAGNAFERQERLLAQGFTTRPLFDQARTAWETALAQVDDAEAQLETAQDRVGFTELRARAAGVVTSRMVEPGEVVQPGQPVLRLAGGEGRDAVFDVPARVLDRGFSDLPMHVALAEDPSVVAEGRVREVGSQADPVTRTFRVRVGLESPPDAMRLGGTVNGTADFVARAAVAIPAGALTIQGRSPAVWIVDPAAGTVSLRPVEVLRYEAHRVVLAGGLDPGETIVIAGIQALHPGQKIEPLPPAAPAPPKSEATFAPPGRAGADGRG